jgi:uncharacterized OsmC-like protein
VPDIKSGLEKAIAYLSEHPDEARYTDSVATATLEQGLRVRVEGPGGAAVSTDMVASVGGSDSAPSPGWLFRAALAASQATLIAMEAARAGVELRRLVVTVDSESDDRGILGMDPGVPPGPLSVRVRVETSGMDPAESIVRTATKRSPVYDAVARAIPISVEIN